MSDSSEDENEFTGEEQESKDDGNEAPLEKRRSSSRSISYKDGEDDDDEELEDENGEDENGEGDEDSDDDSDDSDDDDIPLAKLVKKKPAKNGTSAKKKSKSSNGSSKRKSESSSKKGPALKKKASVAASTSSSSKNFEFASAALYGTECDKGLLIQRLLCRWWYAYDWPRNIPEKPPEGYDALDGFPGVFVCTGAGHADVGKILDKRDHSVAPTFRNFAAKSANELRDMLIKAITKQIKQLDESDTTTRKQLESVLKWANKMDTSKADKDATKILKAHSLFES